MENEIMYKGYKIVIEPDEYADSPDQWGDNQAFLIANHKDFFVENKSMSFAVAMELLGGVVDGEELSEAANQAKKDYHIFGLEAYIHSGVVLALSKEGSFPDRQWDVSQLGAVFISREMCQRRDEAEKAARGLLDTWNTYLSGDVWNVQILDDKGEMIDGGGGNYGYDYALDMAKSTVDRLAEWDMKAHVKALKAQIKNNVPLNKRGAL